MLEIGELRSEDRAAWEALARGYKAFYGTPTTDEQYQRTWSDLLDEGSGFYGFGARLDGQLVGITHYLFHPWFWYGDACYLQDLFVAEAARGQGAARALIERVADAARGHGATRLYWLTQENNARARMLYDKLARFNGFLRYDYQL
ncbi:MAG TPA: GNAT family N-acetyltransferase [Streptosporangiaceae bacterium]|nr:GNAT family N-acetyltransferase [Streptosporangiaceae bacterium]